MMTSWASLRAWASSAAISMLRRGRTSHSCPSSVLLSVQAHPVALARHSGGLPRADWIGLATGAYQPAGSSRFNPRAWQRSPAARLVVHADECPLLMPDGQACDCRPVDIRSAGLARALEVTGKDDDTGRGFGQVGGLRRVVPVPRFSILMYLPFPLARSDSAAESRGV